jgi:Flp pilus assembly pilin Flp
MLTILSIFMQQVRARIAPNSKGQGLVEYSIIVVLIAIAAIAILSSTSSSISGEFQKIINGLR